MEFLLELVFDLFVEGIEAMVKNFKINLGFKIIIGIMLIITFSVIFIWTMNKLDIW